MTPSEPLPASDLLCFLRDKLADAERSLRCREEMAKTTPPISEEELEALKARPGVIVTKGRKLTKAQVKDMEEEPKRQSRIAATCRREVMMFKAVIAAMESQHNAELSDR